MVLVEQQLNGIKSGAIPYILDTDWYLQDAFPEWGSLRIWSKRDRSPIETALEKAVYFAVGEAIRTAAYSSKMLVFTNVWSLHMMSSLANCLPDGRFPLGVFRRDPSEIVELMNGRGSKKISQKTAELWVRGVEKNSDRFKHLVWLERGEFISDVLGGMITDDGEKVAFTVPRFVTDALEKRAHLLSWFNDVFKQGYSSYSDIVDLAGRFSTVDYLWGALNPNSGQEESTRNMLYCAVAIARHDFVVRKYDGVMSDEIPK